jgi:DNA transformation protein and related proteins
MASRQSCVDFILEQIAEAGTVSAKKMFGEYGIYCNEKIVALICDDQLFVKPTSAGKAFIGDCVEGFPYPGAKPYLLIPGEKWDDRDWLANLIKISASELPLSQKKPKKKAP